MQISCDIFDRKAVLALNGRFDFTLHKDFRDAYEQALANRAVRDIEINLREVDYLDSSALGMLLLLKDRAAEAGATIHLSHCREPVRQILEIANFHKLFAIS